MKKDFPSQMDNEQVYLILREHWAVLLLKFIVWLFFASALIVFNRFVAANLPALTQGTWGQITAVFEEIYTLFLVLALFLIFVFHYLNEQIITGIRVVEITQEGLFSHVISELHIDKIEDATSESNGFFGTIFNYGNVFVQTAGATDRFEFHNVPDPAAVEKLVLNLYEKNSNFAQDTAINKGIEENTESRP